MASCGDTYDLYELQALREYKERTEWEREREREERKRQMREEAEARMRQADSWPEAFEKQIGLLQREGSTFFLGGPIYGPDEGEHWWQADIRVIETARQIWAEEDAAVRAQIEALEKARAEKVAERVAAAFAEDTPDARRSACDLADALRNDRIGNWLDW
jgi:hypothetical protein